MSRNRFLRLLGIVGILSVVIGVIAYGFLPRSLETVNFDIDTSNFPELSVLNSDGSEPGIVAQCFFKVHSQLSNSDGEAIVQRDSQFFIGSPLAFSGQGEARGDRGDKSGFDIFPRIRCEPSETASGIVTQTRLIIDEWELKFDVYSQDSKKNLVHTFSKTESSLTDIDLTYGVESEIFAQHISPESIIKNLDSGKYETFQEIRVAGNIEFYFQGFGNNLFTLHIPDTSPNDDCECSPRTYFLIEVDSITSDSDISNPGGGAGGGDINVIEEPIDDNNNGLPSDGIILDERTFESCLAELDFECVFNQRFTGQLVVSAALLLGAVIILPKVFKNKEDGEE